MQCKYFILWKHFHNPIPQLFKEMLPSNRNRNFFWSPQLESFIAAIFGIFWLWNPVNSWKKQQRKNLVQLSLYSKFWVSRETVSSTNIFGWFLNHPELRKKDQKVAELAGDCREMRNCGSQILKVCNRSSAPFFCYATLQSNWLSAILRSCSGFDLNCRCPPLHPNS